MIIILSLHFIISESISGRIFHKEFFIVKGTSINNVKFNTSLDFTLLTYGLVNRTTTLEFHLHVQLENSYSNIEVFINSRTFKLSKAKNLNIFSKHFIADFF